jgi:hypothetical protein
MSQSNPCGDPGPEGVLGELAGVMGSYRGAYGEDERCTGVLGEPCGVLKRSMGGGEYGGDETCRRGLGEPCEVLLGPMEGRSNS